MVTCGDPRYVVDTLAWMRAEVIWPNRLRYLLADAFGLVLLRYQRGRDDCRFSLLVDGRRTGRS
jgi:hypothetical protein